ncbi:MAG: hypothetical protein IJU33_04985 [Bacteroidales bacterium]|nr:hypothetical protein [Bacteroidales bacterium]
MMEGKAGTIHSDVYQAYSDNLRKAVGGVFPQGKPGDPYFDLEAQLQANVSRFAAYKAYHLTEQLKKQREKWPDDGDFKNIAKAVLNTFNRYQAAEYNTATARARTAKQWTDFNADPIANELYPNLKWLPSRSASPREEHAVFYNRVWAKTDPFWSENQPGNLWNCKCDWEETDEGVTEGNPTGVRHAKGLEGNPAVTGEIFTQECTYFKNAGKKGTEVVEEFFRPIKEHHNEYMDLSKNPDYNEVKFDWGTGGMKATHVKHAVHSADKEETFFKELTQDGEGLTSTQLEANCQDILYRRGNSAILCEEGKLNANGGADTSLDLLLNEKRMDIASITENKEYYMYPLSRKNHQLGKYNRLEYVSESADSVCLYFHDPSMYSPEKVLKGFEQFKLSTYVDKKTGELKHHTIRIKHIYCVINEGEGVVEVFDVE